MTTDTEKQGQTEKAVTFKCKFCGKNLPLDEMSIITRYFPPIVSCKACEKTIH
jgi:translation initiation factor 2 beta subunit (eIF-2beta)/eIF-5